MPEVALTPHTRHNPYKPLGHNGMLEKSVIGVIVIGALYFGSELFVPLAIAVLLAFALSPVVRFLRRRRVPQWLAVTVTVLLAFLIIFFVGAIVTRQVTELGLELPRYQAALKDKVKAISNFTGGEGGAIDRASDTLRDLQQELENGSAEVQAPPRRGGADVLGRDSVAPIPVEIHPPPPTAIQQIATIIAVALSPLATMGIIVVFVVFLLLKQKDVRDRAIRLLGTHDLERTTTALDDAGGRLSSYFLTLVLMNAGFGAAIGLGLWLIGIPNPVLWGILAMLLRFMPIVGVFIAAAIPVVLAAAVDPGWLMLGAVVALYLVLEGIMNVVVETWLQTTSTGLSALAILLAAAFWTVLWGPIGLLLAVPLTAVLVVLGRHVEGLNFLHVLLGDTPPLTPAESFYQRMLADDPHEAAEQAEELLKETPLIDYYDDVVMEGLKLAQIDADLKKLEASRLPDIRDAAVSMIESLSDQMAENNGETAAGIAEIPEVWREDGAVTCVAGQSALDELAAIILVQLLRHRGFKPKLMRMADLSSAQMEGAEINGTKIVCVSIFDIEHRGAYLKFLVRRLRRIFPSPSLLGAFWKHDADNIRLADIAGNIPDRVKSLAEAVAYCVNRALADAAKPTVEAQAQAS
ncbi:MAG: AI-2E family transporter [Rhizobiales bacterium]|nr:AI-2E family transporter [Hyphomicrobiales bacterium]